MFFCYRYPHIPSRFDTEIPVIPHINHFPHVTFFDQEIPVRFVIRRVNNIFPRIIQKDLLRPPNVGWSTASRPRAAA